MTEPSTEAAQELAQLRRQLAQALAERDQAYIARDAILREMLPLPPAPRAAPRRLRLGLLAICAALLALTGAVVLRHGRWRDARSQRSAVASGAVAERPPHRAAPEIGRPGRLVEIPVPGLGAIAEMALAVDGRRVAVADTTGRVAVVALGRDAVVARVQSPGAVVRALEFGPDGVLITGASDGSVRAWDATGRPERVLRRSGPPVRALALAGGRLAVAGEAPTIALVALDGGASRVLDGRAEWIRAVAISADGRWLAAGGHDGVIRLFELATGRVVAELEGHRLWISALAFSPDAKLLASAGLDKTVRLWDIAGLAQGTWRPWRVLHGHVREAVALAFSPAGGMLVSGSLDRRAIVWDLERGLPRVELVGHRWQVAGAAFTPRARFVLTAGGEGALRLWPLPPPQSAVLARLPPPGPGEVTFRNNTTGERRRVRLVGEDGSLLAAGQRELSVVLRSRPDDETKAIDPRLAELVYKIADHFDRSHEVVVISGFRSTRYNKLRTRQSRQVAENSRHLRGEATDLRIDGVSITVLRDYVSSLGAGGVGFYADSQFVHVDVGPVRHWTGD